MLYGSTYLLSRTTILREQNSSTPSGAPKQRIAMHNKRRGLISGMSSKFEAHNTPRACRVLISDMICSRE